MSDYPKAVEHFRQSILSIPGVVACEIGLKDLESIDVKTVGLPGEFADLPQVAIYRTGGGRKDEALVVAEILFERLGMGWVALEFLAWWVRDCARSGDTMQLRALALPPEGFERQLGAHLKFALELFVINESNDVAPLLEIVDEHAEGLTQSIAHYRESIENPIEPSQKPELW